MSRSFKRYPFCRPKVKHMKTFSNRRVRRKLKNPNFFISNKEYKKIFNSYDICDYYCYSSWQMFKAYQRKIWYERKFYPFFKDEVLEDDRSLKKKWYKIYKMK